jgi:hypothetical protein
MIFENFEIMANPKIINAYCKCGNEMIEVSNGFLSVAVYCEKCKKVYIPVLKDVTKKADKEFIKQCEEIVKIMKERKEKNKC